MESLTGLDIDGDGHTGEAPAVHTVLASTYESAKEYYNQSKEYKLASSFIVLAESVSVLVLSKTGPFTGIGTLEQVDNLIKPRLVSTDEKISPFVTKTIAFSETAVEKAKPVVALAYKVPLVERSANMYAAIGSTAYGVAVKNLEKLSEALLIENPENTGNGVVAQ